MGGHAVGKRKTSRKGKAAEAKRAGKTAEAEETGIPPESGNREYEAAAWHKKGRHKIQAGEHREPIRNSKGEGNV